MSPDNEHAYVSESGCLHPQSRHIKRSCHFTAH